MDNDLTTFQQQLADFSDLTIKAITQVFQDVVIDLGESVIYLSPVLTGRFRGNWQLTIGRASDQSLVRYDPDGASTLATLVNKAGELEAGEVAWIVNNLNYGPLIETGDHSAQAPNGVVRVTAARFTTIVEQAIAKRKVTS